MYMVHTDCVLYNLKGEAVAAPARSQALDLLVSIEQSETVFEFVIFVRILVLN